VEYDAISLVIFYRKTSMTT